MTHYVITLLEALGFNLWLFYAASAGLALSMLYLGLKTDKNE